jgi:hypothetical protein
MVKVSRSELITVAVLSAVVMLLLVADLTGIGDRIAKLIEPPSYSALPESIDSICPAAIVDGVLRAGCSGAALGPSTNITGFVENASMTESGLHISGWAADLANKSPLALIVATVNGVVRAGGVPTANRPDVASGIGVPGAIRSGFDLVIITDVRLQPDELKIRVFGISQDGRARELEYIHPLFKQR